MPFSEPSDHGSHGEAANAIGLRPHARTVFETDGQCTELGQMLRHLHFQETSPKVVNIFARAKGTTDKHHFRPFPIHKNVTRLVLMGCPSEETQLTVALTSRPKPAWF